jgi:hypothetical protein
VLASNAAMRAEVVPGRAKEVERNGVTNDDAQRELFGEKRAQLLEENDSEKKPTRHPLLVLRPGSRSESSQWRFSAACIVQASCASWRSRAVAAAIKRIIRDERRRRGEPVSEMEARGPPRGPPGQVMFAFR